MSATPETPRNSSGAAAAKGMGVLVLLLFFALALVGGAFVYFFAIDDAAPQPWDSVDGDGTRLTVNYTGSECENGNSLEVVEEKERVVLTLSTDVDDTCTAAGVQRTVTAVLKSALGERELVDGACRTDEWRDTPACTDKPE